MQTYRSQDVFRNLINDHGKFVLRESACWFVEGRILLGREQERAGAGIITFWNMFGKIEQNRPSVHEAAAKGILAEDGSNFRAGVGSDKESRGLSIKLRHLCGGCLAYSNRLDGPPIGFER